MAVADESLTLATFDDIYDHVGHIGMYQLRVFALIGLVAIVPGYQDMAMTYVGAKQDHWCDVPRLGNLSSEQHRHIAIPIETKTSGSKRYEQCRMFDLPYSEYSQESLENWNRSLMTGNASIIECERGWTFDKSIFVSTVISQFNLVCNRAWMAPLISTIYMVGTLFGSISSGAFGDRYGRRLVVVIAIMLQTLFAVSAAIVPNYVGFVFLRIGVAACNAAAYTSGFVIVMEVIGPKHRVLFGIVMQMCYAVGFMLLSGLSFAIRNHQLLQVALGVLPIGLISLYWLLPPSPRWLLSVGRHDECIEVIRKMARVNAKSLPDEIIFEDNEKKDAENIDGPRPNVVDLFKHKNLRKNTIIIWFDWMVNSLVYFGLSLSTGDLAGSIHLNTLLNAFVEIPAYALTIVLLIKLGRRLPFAGMFLFAGLATIAGIPLLYYTDYPAIATTLALLGKMAISSSFAIVFVYAAEIFPTPVRNVGVGGASSTGRIGAIAAPQIGPLRETVWVALPAVIFGSFSMAAGFLTLLLPETKNKKLPETVAEGEAFGRKPTNKIKKGDATESSSIYSVTGKYMDNEAYVRDDVMDSINHTASYNFTNL